MPADPLWTAKQDSISLPGQVGLPGLRHSIGLARWWHLGGNTLWLANGLLFYVLLFATGQWRRLIRTSWAAFPNALSVAVQYASLDWPTENGWVAYNSLDHYQVRRDDRWYRHMTLAMVAHAFSTVTRATSAGKGGHKIPTKTSSGSPSPRSADSSAS